MNSYSLQPLTKTDDKISVHQCYQWLILLNLSALCASSVAGER